MHIGSMCNVESDDESVLCYWYVGCLYFRGHVRQSIYSLWKQDSALHLVHGYLTDDAYYRYVNRAVYSADYWYVCLCTSLGIWRSQSSVLLWGDSESASHSCPNYKSMWCGTCSCISRHGAPVCWMPSGLAVFLLLLLTGMLYHCKGLLNGMTLLCSYQRDRCVSLVVSIKPVVV